jgi:hypothetical protein
MIQFQSCAQLMIYRTVQFKDAVQSDLRVYTKEPSFYLQTVYLGFC